MIFIPFQTQSKQIETNWSSAEVPMDFSMNEQTVLKAELLYYKYTYPIDFIERVL